jgi:hypothetical protein
VAPGALTCERLTAARLQRESSHERDPAARFVVQSHSCDNAPAVKKGTILHGAFVAGLLVIFLAIGVGYRQYQQNFGYDDAIPTATAPAMAVAEPHPSFLYGRVAIWAGETYEGRLRWGRDQEAFWGEYFNGVKAQNPWAAHLPPELRKEPLKLFGIGMGSGPIDLTRPFMARFGDIARIDRVGRDVRVTLKSGTAFDLDYSALNDFDDGVRVWDRSKGVLDLGQRRVRTIDLLATSAAGESPRRLRGTVRTRAGDFTGFVQWNRNKSLGTDELVGRTGDNGDLTLRFDTILSIARQSDDSSRVSLRDGREVLLSGTRDAGHENLGIYVDDRRYGRVLISWQAFERVEFSPSGTGPSYGDFPPGLPLKGVVTVRGGQRLEGRLVYDLDESETTETLDAPAQGVDYIIPFGLIASIVRPDGETRVWVTLQNREALQLDRLGDLGEQNGGMLIFPDGSQRAAYVRWTDVRRIDFQHASR